MFVGNFWKLDWNIAVFSAATFYTDWILVTILSDCWTWPPTLQSQHTPGSLFVNNVFEVSSSNCPFHADMSKLLLLVFQSNASLCTLFQVSGVNPTTESFASCSLSFSHASRIRIEACCHVSPSQEWLPSGRSAAESRSQIRPQLCHSVRVALWFLVCSLTEALVAGFAHDGPQRESLCRALIF